MKDQYKIGILIDNYYGQYQRTVCRGIEKKAQETNTTLFYYDGLLHAETYEYSGQEKYIYNLVKHHNFLDGIIVFHVSMQSTIPADEINRMLKSIKNIPMCCLSAPFENSKCVKIDNEQGIKQAIDHLYNDHDCRRFGFVGGPEGIEDADVRYHTFLNHLKHLGVEFNPAHYFEGQFQRFSGKDAVEKWHEEGNFDLDAILCANDETAFGVIIKLKELGYKIPEDIKVTGYDNVEFCSIISPSLTTVEQPLESQGYKALELLLDDKNESHTLTLDSNLKIRNSCCEVVQSKPITSESVEASNTLVQGIRMKVNNILCQNFEVYYVETFLNKYFNPEVQEFTESELTQNIKGSIAELAQTIQESYVSTEISFKYLELINSELAKTLSIDSCQRISGELNNYLVSVTQKYYSSFREAALLYDWHFFSFSMELNHVRSMNELWDVCEKVIPRLGIKHCCVLQVNNPLDISIQTNWSQPSYLYNYFTLKHGERINANSPQQVTISNFFPAGFIDKNIGSHFIIKPLHFNNEFYGYIVLSVEKQVQTPFFYDHIKFSLLKIFQEQSALKKLLQSKNTIEQENLRINNLLKLTKEGFLSFGKDKKIQNQYSTECMRIFQKDIRGKTFSSLIYPDDKASIDMIDKIFDNMFSDRDSSAFQSLLPERLTINTRQVQLEYVLLDNVEKPEIMIILQDITHKLEIENQKNKKESHEKMLLKILGQPEFYFSTNHSFEPYINSIKEKVITKNNYTLDEIVKINRNIHTFKGMYLQLEITEMSDVLNKLEDILFVVSNTYDQLTDDDDNVKDAMESITNCYHTFINERQKIEISVGKVLKNKQGVFTSKEDFDKLLSYFDDNQGKPISKDEINKIKSLTYKPLGDLLEPYIIHTQTVANEEEKQILPFEIYTDDGILVDIERFMPFIQTLGHIFRNSIIHGIEAPYVREEVGKMPEGVIHCEARLIGDKKVKLIISDDGNGIDNSILIQKAMELNIDMSHVQNPTDLIFHDSFSTKDEVGMYAGRGVGLCAVKEEIEKLDGTIEVESNLGQGTTFILEFPID